MKTLSEADLSPRSSRRAWLAAGLAGTLVPPWARARSRALRFGLTPVFLDDRVRLLRLWARYLEARLGKPIEFVQFSAYNQVMDALRASQLDFAWICGYPYVLHRAELQLVTVPLWRGKPVYQSYLITDTSSAIASVEELRGRTFAYSDPLSNSGFLYVQHLLRSRQQDPSRYFSRSFFTYSHRHVVEAVAQGLAVAGAVDGYVWETLAEVLPDMAGNTRVLLRSPDFGFPPIVAPRGTAEPIAQRFARALQDMNKHSEGQAVLGELRLDGFAAPQPGLFSSIEAMARAHKA